MKKVKKNGLRSIYWYDDIVLLEPINIIHTYRHRQGMEDAGLRMRYWECAQNQNNYLAYDEDGRPITQYRLPGDPGYIDLRGVPTIRNPDLPVGLMAQERSPVFDNNFDF